jgi:putative hemolysin
MELISRKEVAEAAKLQKLGGENLAGLLMSVLKLDKINKIYADHYQKPAMDFLKNVLSDADISYKISDVDLNKIPRKGAFVLIANHPYGGLEGIILLNALLQIRPDLKMMGNFLLTRIEPLKDLVIPVNPFDDLTDIKQNVSGVMSCLNHLEKGNSLVIFPAGEVSTYQPEQHGITDKKWNKGAVKLIMKAKVPVVPAFFQGTNSQLFHWLGFIHPLLRTAKIPSELLNKRSRQINVRIGAPISVAEQELFVGVSRFGRFLRAKTYSLGFNTNVNTFFSVNKFTKPQEIIAPVSKKLMCDELLRIPDYCELFSVKNYTVYCTPVQYIPEIMNEIGRLRETTFREIGEGSNNSIDIDEYDLYYHQLFIWDNEAKAVVGGYRVGLGDEIISQYGIKGFYTRSLFKMDVKLQPMLMESVELGRSFVTIDYQRKPLSLFLLWKGILVFLLRNEKYRYLIGPVSISNNFSDMSQQLIVNFIRQNYFMEHLGKLIQPKKPYIPVFKHCETDILTEEINNLTHLDNLIADIETSGARIPVLLKKYLSMGGRIASFNVDPAFNNSLDGFLVLDLADIPKETIQSLSKELNDEKLGQRFNL